MPGATISKTQRNDAVDPHQIRTVLVLQHDDDTDIALIGRSAQAAGAVLSTCHPTREPLPAPAALTGIDALVVLGSADSVNDPAISPWFDAEIALIRDADRLGIPVFGICFGAQALAVALGGSVDRAPYGEYGWKIIDTVNPMLVPEGPWFQWHVDAITPPAEAEIIATSDCCVQAYRIGPHLAVQFHPEVTEVHAKEWPASDPEGLAASGMTAADMLEITQSLHADAVVRADGLWSAFVSNAGTHR